MASGASRSLSSMAPVVPLLADLPFPLPSMGTQPSSVPSSPRIPLSRKRPIAAALPSIGLIPSKKEKPLLPLPSADEFDRRKRERLESDSSSQSSVSSQGSSSDESSSSGLPSHIIDFVLEEPSSASSTPGGATPSEPPVKQPTLTHNTVSARQCQVNAFHDRSVVIEKQQECARVIFCEKTPGNTLGPNLESGSVINGYRIIGMGKDASALHLETNEVYNVKLITEKDFQTTLQVAERLEKAQEMCGELGWDIEELSEAVLPSETEVVEQELEGGKRFVLFTPFEYSNLHVMASNASSSSQFGLPEEKVAAYFKQICSMIAFCHQLGIVVRDLKPRKLVFANQSQTKIRLSDVFDVAVCDSVSDDVVTEKFGSPAYIPPEVLTARLTGFAGRPADVWGLGVLTFLLLSGKYPFYDSNPRGVFKRIRRAHVCFPTGLTLSRAARDMVHCMLRKRPEDRPSALLLSQIPWMPVKDSQGTFRERVNHMISPLTNPLRRQRPIIIPSSDVLSEHEVPETHLRVTDDGIYVGVSRRGREAVHSSTSSERAVPTPFPTTRFPLNEWPYASEMEARVAIESRLPTREGAVVDHFELRLAADSIPRQPAHLRI